VLGFRQEMQEVSGDDMASMGLEIVSFVIKDISELIAEVL